jgi:hypothetical protein
MLPPDLLSYWYDLSKVGSEWVPFFHDCSHAALSFSLSSCFKWPLGDAAASSAAAPATGFQRYDTAQHALTSLLQLVAKLITPTADVGLFSTPASPSTGSSAVISAKASGNGTDLSSKHDVITAFASFAAPHLPAVQSVRRELVSTLHLLLEWVTTDFSKVQNARYVQDLLVCLITVQVVPTEGDALGSAELILMHVRNLVYHPNGELGYALILVPSATYCMHWHSDVSCHPHAVLPIF